MSEEPSAVDSLLDTLRFGVVILDTAGRVLLWGPTTEELLGWRSDEAAGHRFTEYLVAEEREADPAPRLYAALRRGRLWRGALRARHRDGHTVEIEGRASLLEDADGEPFILANVVEISRLRAIEHDLAALDALFDSSPLGIALFDEQKRFVRVNQALERLNGMPAERMLGRTVEEVLPPGVAREVAEVQAAVLSTGRTLVDMVMTAPDGRGARSVSYSRLTDRAGQVIGTSCTVMDITERRDALEKAERSRERLSLLDDVGVALGDLLDVREISQALAESLVPRFWDYAGVMLHGAVVYGDELPGRLPVSGVPLLQLGVAGKRRGLEVERMLRVGQDIAFAPDSFFATVLASGRPHLASSQRELADATFPGDPKVQAAIDLGIHSLMTVPLRARGIVLGLLVISRADDSEPFDRDDVALVMELAARAGTSLDNARLYAREREGALMLQRSLLPQRVPSPPGTRVGYRYVPGSSGTEVGGDWFDVIPLAGGRVALVVGDVMGHGLRAAATMGRLRTAVRTLAALDLSPDELLRRVHDLADDLAQGPEEPLMATCVYAVYDPSTRLCCIAKAGHVPPLLVTPDAATGRWRARPLALPSGAPLGVGGVPFEAREFTVEEGAVLVLYTDGLIESRHEDISEGLDRLCARLSGAEGELDVEDLCDDVIGTLAHGGASAPESVDDVALLLTQLGGLPVDSAAAWTFPAEVLAVRRARHQVRRTLEDWGLTALTDEATLLVSELVTNALRYAHGPIGVRMVRGASLLVEVSDPLPDPPRARVPAADDEGGRGIQLVARSARRWGTRHGAIGKTVWFELTLPGEKNHRAGQHAP
ncbi:SpoIIE family protein phosphatase [Streptomyces sp. TRM 70351]|uniref:SpoIIE family protein phosphatase n=1 Tax=Streptomyces sp. TRM 70351 TaxID=3116552 RepID=UPI002E7BAB24|nr:SpoIIE family protein phosphatase [Streptomyces sp. TRM 70351]MEE1927752.1 SpoIIE family protein phosphatase [Streptomyces sp. TRM 70351]